MKLPTFSAAQRQWDRYRAFHTMHRGGLLVQFETGELMLGRMPSHDDRGEYTSYGVELIASTDLTGKHKLSLPGGDPVAKAWVASGQQFIVDHDHKKMWAIEYSRGKLRPAPGHLVYSPAYCVHPDADWVTNGLVRLDRPDEQRKKELAEVRKTFQAMCKARVALEGLPGGGYSPSTFKIDSMCIRSGDDLLKEVHTLAPSAVQWYADNALPAPRMILNAPYLNVHW
jgi:hypothetical protein